MTVKRIWRIYQMEGSSLKGRIITTLDDFANTFGFGHDGLEAKTTTEWYFTTSWGIICVYDYHYNKHAPQLSIGASSHRAALEAISYFSTRGFRTAQVGSHG